MRKVIILSVLLFATSSFAMDDSNVPHFWTGTAMGIAADTVAYHYAKRMDTMERVLVSSGYVEQTITQIDTAKTDNQVSPDWTARAARQGEANGRIKSTLSGWKLKLYA